MVTANAPSITPALLTMDEYLRTSYHPDCDFVDGLVEERNVGETPHSLLQVELAFWFRSHRADWKIRVLTELRTRVGQERVRIPNISVVHDDEAIRGAVRMTPPLIALEILSAEDRMGRVIKRLQDFLTMGVEHIWLLDPVERVAYTFSEGGLKLAETPRLTLPDSPIYLDLPAVFAALD